MRKKTPANSAASLQTPRQRHTLGEFVGYHLRRASVYDLNGAVAALEPVDGRPITMSVLLSIVDNPGSTSAEICRALGIKRANIVGLLQQLEAKNLFLRRDDPADQRIQRLYPTQEGIDTADDWARRVMAHEERMLQRLSERERAQLCQLLERLWIGEPSQD